MRSLLVSTLTLALATPALAGTLAGVSMSQTAKAGNETLALNGMALRKRAIFKVYVGGLYLPEKQADPQQVLASDTPRQFVMHWLRSVGKDAICDGWYEGLEANTPDASADLEGDFDRLCSFMEDARAADRFLFTYLPGEGTEVQVKGKQKGLIEGKAFADALFACWIGPHPGPGESFRDALMGL